MLSLREILNDPNYINANEATKRAIFERYAPQDENFVTANPATQEAIRQRFGVATLPPQEELDASKEVSAIPSPDEPISAGQRTSDYSKLFAAPIVQGLADLPQGLLDAAIAVPRAFATGEALERGPVIPRVLDKSVQLIRNLFGTSLSKQQEERLAGKIATDKFITEAKSLFELPRFFEYLSEAGEDVADKLRKSVSSRTQQKLEATTPKGNFLEAVKTGDFSKLSFGDDPTLEGYAAHTVQILGSLAPVIATAIITKGATTPSAVVGGGMAAGEGAGEAREYVKSLSDEQLTKMSPYYANMRSAGINESKARKVISDRAAEQAAFLQGSVGALGGVFTSKLVTGKLDNYFTSKIRSRLGRIVALGGVGAAEEGTQEFLEGIAADIGIDKEVVKEIGAESFANLILGSIGGGAVGVGRGAISSPTVPQPQNKEDRAIADLDKFIAAEEAKLTDEEKEDEANLAAQVAAREDLEERGVDVGIPLPAEVTTDTIPASETVPATLEELNKIDKDLKKQLGRVPTTEEVERALNDFEQKKTRDLRAESGGREPFISMPSKKEAISRTTGTPSRIEPTGLGAGIGTPVSVGARKEPTLGALKPEDTAVFANIEQPTGISSEGNVALQNYFKTYYGLPPQSLPKAAGVLMPSMQRAEALLQKYFQAYNQSNLPFLGTGPWEQGKRNANRPPEYVEAQRYMPSGEIRRLANAALAIDKKYKTKGNDPERFVREIAAFEEQLDNFEKAINNLPPPLTNEERQAKEADYDAKNLTPDYNVVSKEQQLRAFVNQLRKEPQRLARAPVKSPVYTPTKADPAKLQEAIDAGFITQEELDKLQKQSDDFFAETPTEPTASTEPTRFKTAEDLNPEDRAAYDNKNAEIRASMKEATDAAKERGIPFANAAAPFVDQLRALDQSYGLGEPVSKRPKEGRGVRPAKDEEDGIVSRFFSKTSPETIKAKTGVNARRLSKLLGPKLYGEPKEMPLVSVKEMVQNAFDAIKPMQEKGQLKKGKISIEVDPSSRFISVTDNGTGMSPETLSTTFLTIAGTKKEGERDSGGLGIAKMQFLFNNDRIRVVTMRDGVASELKSTGAQLEESMDNPDVNPNINVYRGNNIPDYVKKLIPEGHGTYVEVDVPATYQDTSTGEDKPINIPDYHGSYTVLRKSPLFGDIDVKFNGQTLDIGANFPYDDYTTFANVNFDWGVARVYVSREEKDFWDNNVSVLSNGLWQFDKTLKANDKTIQRQVYVDVTPKKSVKPEDAGYPFDLNRQRFSPAVEKSFEQIFKYLSLVYRAADLASSARDFGEIEYLDKSILGKVTHSDSIKLEPPLSSNVIKASQISEGDQIEVKEGVLYVKGKVVPELTDADLKAISIDVDDLKIDPSLISKDRVMLHINAGVSDADSQKVKDVTNKIDDLENEIYAKYKVFTPEKIPDIDDRNVYKNKLKDLVRELKQAELGNITSITKIGRDKFGNRFDEFLFDIGDAFKSIRDFLPTLDVSASGKARYRAVADEAIGISIDAQYRGVSIKVPFSGVFVNPFAPAIPDLSAAAAGTWGTMVHELAHVIERYHDADFASEMQRINLLLEASELDGNPTWPNIKKQISSAFRKYKDVFEYFNKEFNSGNLKPIGKRLSDSSEEQVRDARTPERVAGSRSATEGEPGISGQSDLRSENIGEERERARDAGEATTSELEQRVIELSLKSGDIHPTMVSAIANNDLNGALQIASQRLTGFSAELARTLLALKLPTNISFNSGRELVRRSIDRRSEPEQQRLFRYVQMHYPQVYEKYFKNYDRSESLESVSDGLIELQKPNYKLGPVIAEYDTVAGVYQKYIAGLTSPGAYYPDFDEIALDTNTLTGKSYRVLLHEVVHAATEHVLNTSEENPQSLTPGQRAAVEELTKMYNYALEKLGDAPYGMTNIYEFIAEVFTNKRFQELLKTIEYEPKKTPFLSRLIKSILKTFGLDNLAGNAMAEATKIFSAVRTEAPADRGPRFAKTGPKGPRIRGPISTPQTWRTAESQTTSMINLFNDAIKGRRSWDEVLKVIGPSMWSAGTGQFRRAVLGVLNLRQIDDLTKTKFPQISGAVRMLEKMLAYRGNIMKSAEDIIKEWTKAQANKPKQGQLLNRIMIEATIRGIDPDRPGTKPMNAAFVQAWNTLDPEFKKIYRQVRDFYATAVNNMVREMKLKVAKSDKPLSEKKAAIKEINDKFGPDKLVQPYFPLRRFGRHWFQVGKGNFKEFYEFEDPFSRELAMRSREAELRKGNAQQQALADTLRKGDGLSELFTQNMTTTQVLKEAQDIIDNVTATTVDDAKKEMKDSLNQLIYILLPQQSMRKMFINRKAIQGASGDMLRVFATSAVHSAYQQSRFKFAEPFLNNLATAVEYVEEFSDRDRASVYRDYIAEVEKRVPYILSNEDTSLAAMAAGKASEITFFYMLSAPFSAMLNLLGVAAITMPYIGGRYGYAKANALMLKNLGRYLATTPSRTIAPLARGSIMQAQFPSIAEGGRLTGVLKQAADRFIEEGQINISLTNDLMDMGERPSELYTGRYNMVKKMLSGLFHQSERLGREVSLLTTFELAYEKFSKSPKKDLRGIIERDAQGNPVMNTPDEAFELAIIDAKDIVGLSMGDYTRQMKPRYFVSPLMSVITKFKQYSVVATYAVARNFYFTVAAPFRKAEIEEFRRQMLKDKISPKVIEQRLAEAEAQRVELYQEGRRRLAGILGVTYLLGGNEASPFYSIGLGTLVKLLADEDDDEFFDWENWLKNYMEEELGGAAGDFFAEMGMNPETASKAGRFVGGALQRGLVAETIGGELASRVSLDPKNLWYREGRYSPDVRENVIEEVIANAGPVVGLGFNWLDAYRLFQEGQYQRAFERAAPALISRPVAAARVAEEDARTASGIKLADNFSAWELAMLGIGLQPTRLSQAQKSAIEAKQYTEKIKDRRNTLLTRLWMERDNKDGFNETLEKIREFSRKYPNQRIEPDDIVKSFERRAENQAKAEAIGGQFDNKSLPDALQMLRYGRQ